MSRHGVGDISLTGGFPSFERFEHKGAFAYVGGNFIGTDFAKGHRVALEVGTPVGKPSLIAILGWQKTF